MKKLSLPFLAIIIVIVGVIALNVFASFEPEEDYYVNEETTQDDSWFDSWDEDDYNVDNYDWEVDSDTNDDFTWDDDSEIIKEETYTEIQWEFDDDSNTDDATEQQKNKDEFKKPDYLEEYLSYVNTDYRSMYYQLNSTEKRIYNAALEACSAGKSSFKINNISIKDSSDEIFRGYWGFYLDHPEFFWLNCGAYYSSYNAITKTLTIKPSFYTFWEYSLTREKYTQPMQFAISKIVTEAQTYNTDYEKIKYVHDYLVNNCEYDYYALERISNINVDPQVEYAYTSYGALVENSCVCDGYSKAFQIIMHLLDIHCDKIHGQANGGAHSWNLVEIDGEKYYLDITWDDPSNVDDVVYNYFLITTEQLEKTHTIEEDYFEYENCDSTRYMDMNITDTLHSTYTKKRRIAA